MSVNKLAAELLGTYVLVLGGSAKILSAAKGGAPTNIVIVAFGFGLALVAGLYAFGEISGAHYNPGVSLAIVLDQRMAPMSMAGDWVAQLVGATLASLTILVATSTNAVASTLTTFGEGVEAWEVFVFEAVYTAILPAVILRVTKSEAAARRPSSRHRPHPDDDPPRTRPIHGHVGESGSFPRSGNRRRCLERPVGLLDRSARWRGDRLGPLQARHIRRD